MKIFNIINELAKWALILLCLYQINLNTINIHLQSLKSDWIKVVADDALGEVFEIGNEWDEWKESKGD